eukprot:TRINITY_DN16849_c0_g1_i1.p1 TRINITY_DN16849_c0_g1~~TRINITY_DN16849_c0_g1_i1.p1  ORF type:complete len:592 (-),score=97.56 TRINITY_DN16849_c0_g1_i1:377-2152(-)
MAEGSPAAEQPVEIGACRFYRLRVTKLRSEKTKSVQLERVLFRAGGASVTPHSCTNPGGENPKREGPDNVIIDKSSKWLDKKMMPLVFEFEEPVLLDSYTWKTANDAVGRDMIQWFFECSADGEHWQILHSQDSDFETPLGRHEVLPFFTLRPHADSAEAAVPQVSEASLPSPSAEKLPRSSAKLKKQMKSGQASKLVEAAVPEAALPEAGGASPLETSEWQPSPCASPQEAEVGDSSVEFLSAEMLAALPDDAPEGDEAHKKVRYAAGDPSRGGQRCTFIVGSRRDGGFQFQTTVAACNSRTACERIARACYMRSTAPGATKQDLTEFRDACYKRFLEASPQGVSRKLSKVSEDVTQQSTLKGGNKKRKRSAGTQEVELQGSQLQGAVRIAGRDAKKKNSSINGAYIRLEEQVDGVHAYKKNGAGAPRFLFFAIQKRRWKISDVLGDPKKGFAYLAVTDDGQSGPYSSLCKGSWEVFNGKGSGYAHDSSVSCTLLEDPGEENNENNTSTQLEAGGSNSQSSASTSSDTDAEDSDSGSDISHKGSQAETGGMEAPKPHGRACAKMLVMSGLRCACHFAIKRHCPSQVVIQS